MKVLKGSLVILSKQKFSSNVIEKCLQHCLEKERELLIQEMIGKEGDLNPPLYEMMKDKYANYVVQKAVEIAKLPLRDALVNKIKMIPEPNNYGNFMEISITATHNSYPCVSCCK